MERFGLQLRVAVNGIVYVLLKPAYLVLAMGGIMIVSGFIIWSLNLDLVSYIIFDAPIGFGDKLLFFSATYRDIFTTFGSPQALGIIIFSILFGINTAILFFVVKNQGFKNIPKKSGLGGTLMAIIAGGCVACGTSILAPIVATLGATSSTFLQEFSLWLNWIGSLLIIFSIFKLSQIAASIKSLTTNNQP